MTDIVVRCGPNPNGWECAVDLRDADGSASHHVVTVSNDELDRLDAAAPDPTDLVDRSFAFLLERESKASILATFELSVIGRYFPEYERMIRADPS